MREVSNIFQLLALFFLSFSFINCANLSRSHYRSSEYAGAGNQYQGERRTITPRTKRTETVQLDWPVRQIDISQKFAPPENPSHQGIDLRGQKNDPIYAAHDGTVIYIGAAFRGYGKMIILEYNKRWASLYAHLDSFSVREGQEVAQGQELGRMGRTGRASGVHLHFELMRNKQPLDPYPWLKNNQSYASQ